MLDVVRPRDQFRDFFAGLVREFFRCGRPLRVQVCGNFRRRARLAADRYRDDIELARTVLRVVEHAVKAKTLAPLGVIIIGLAGSPFGEQAAHDRARVVLLTRLALDDEYEVGVARGCDDELRRTRAAT